MSFSKEGEAKQIDLANASRAVGLANGRNSISSIVPYHRVIGTNGQLMVTVAVLSANSGYLITNA
ncbi:MGMT family protein [Mastigocladopsis repens]|uniref:MGMT family protein n=1 Tax=Mastigocladopsis repens TaxID=221287 RepID=UPI00030CB418|nr:MGMT family protein [Mastigocladopsis repens]